MEQDKVHYPSRRRRRTTPVSDRPHGHKRPITSSFEKTVAQQNTAKPLIRIFRDNFHIFKK
jgi:hypothetical protein